jgi:hypothetical protein
MKMNGKIIEGVSFEVIVIPKGQTEHVFKAMPILDESAFLKMCPAPLPPTIIRPGGETSRDLSDKTYLAKMDTWAEQKMAWMVITSLSATPGLEWDTVKMDDPSTWTNHLTELKSCFTETEVQLILNLVFTACGLNQRKIDEATKRFLAGQGQGQKA